jgi:hypothetical protein
MQSIVQMLENPPLIGQGLLHELMLIAVPELLHVHADALHVQVQESQPLIGQGHWPKGLNQW